jgi:repressor LexA
MDKSLIINRIKEYKNFKSDRDLSEFLGITPQSLSTWKSRNSIDFELIFAKCEDVNKNWLLTGKGEMLLNEQHQVRSLQLPKGKIIPLIPTDAAAGYGSGTVAVLEEDIMAQYVVPDFVNADFMIRVKGSSMYPKYNSGDVIACKKIDESGLIQWGKVFLMHHREQGAIVKRLFPSDKEEFLKCVSDNTKYPPFDISKSEIDSIALVVGVIRLE